MMPIATLIGLLGGKDDKELESIKAKLDTVRNMKTQHNDILDKTLDLLDNNTNKLAIVTMHTAYEATHKEFRNNVIDLVEEQYVYLLSRKSDTGTILTKIVKYLFIFIFAIFILAVVDKDATLTTMESVVHLLEGGAKNIHHIQKSTNTEDK